MLAAKMQSSAFSGSSADSLRRAMGTATPASCVRARVESPDPRPSVFAVSSSFLFVFKVLSSLDPLPLVAIALPSDQTRFPEKCL